MSFILATSFASRRYASSSRSTNRRQVSSAPLMKGPPTGSNADASPEAPLPIVESNRHHGPASLARGYETYRVRSRYRETVYGKLDPKPGLGPPTPLLALPVYPPRHDTI